MGELFTLRFWNGVRTPVCTLRLTHVFMKRGLSWIPVVPRSVNENHTAASDTTIISLCLSLRSCQHGSLSRASLKHHGRGRASPGLGPGGRSYLWSPKRLGHERNRGAERNGKVRGHPGGHCAGIRKPGAHGPAANLLRSLAVRHLLQVQGKADFERLALLAGGALSTWQETRTGSPLYILVFRGKLLIKCGCYDEVRHLEVVWNVNLWHKCTWRA